MATILAPREPQRVSERPQLWRPLVKLQRGIRRFIGLEVLLQLGLVLGLICWLGFLADFGLFFLFGFDYVRDGSPSGIFVFRALWWASLIAGAAYLLGYRLLYRLLVWFRPEALALILERRFPQLLEERLITAVELAEPERAHKYGYSYWLVEYTAESAEERLQRIAVRDVFNWGWLRRLFLALLMVWTAAAATTYFATEWVATWWERTVLCKPRHWPVRVLLVLPDFAQQPVRGVPSGGDLPIRVVAWVNVVRTDDPNYPSGWRPATWDDVLGPESPESQNSLWAEERKRFWELRPPVTSAPWREILPLTWRSLTLDELEARHLALAAQQLRPEAMEQLNELGRAVLDYLLPRLEERLRQASETEQALVRLEDNLARWLPESWRDWSVQEICDHLQLARRLSVEEYRRRWQALHRPTITGTDLQWAILQSFSPWPIPQPSAYALQQLAWLTGAAERTPPISWSADDWRDLPDSWRGLSAAELERRLRRLQDPPPLQALGRTVNAQLGQLFAELQRRADQRHWGQRIYYRRLRVYDQVTLEYEELLSEEEGRRMRAQVERLPVNRSPGSFQYRYEFRRIERPRRFRLWAGDDTTPWYFIEVRPLPTLRQLLRWQCEPGHLWASTDWVERGPIPVSIESGQESRFDVPVGSQITLFGQTTKQLESLEIGLQEERIIDRYAAMLGHALSQKLIGTAGAPAGVTVSALGIHYHETHLPSVRSLEFNRGTDQFRVSLRPLGNEELRLLFRFTDIEGIGNTRRITIVPLADKEPEFQYINFEVVRREGITPKAIIPFSGLVRDDNGLTSLEYEITVILPNGQPLGPPTRIPLRTFAPAIPATFPENWEGSTSSGSTHWMQPMDVRGGVAGRSIARALPIRILGHIWTSPLLALTLAPANGPLSLIPVVGLEPVVEHEFRYEMRPPGEPLLTTSDEFLFTELVPREVTVPDPQRPNRTVTKPLTPPYRLVVRLVASDNRQVVVEGDRLVFQPQRTFSHTAFEFNVVTENDLLIEESRREEEIRERCDQLLAKLIAVRDQLVKMRQEAEQLNDDLALRFARDTEDAQRQVRDGRDFLQREVLRDLRLIYRELWFNRVQQKELDRLDEKICRPLEQLVRDNDAFDLAQQALGLLAGRLQTERQRTRPADFDPAVAQMNFLIERFQKVIQEIKSLIEYAKALEILRDLIKSQERINELLKQIHKDILKKELGN